MQIRNLTGVRGFAALWVALYHFQTTAAVVDIPLGPIAGGGTLGVDIFFVLSGLVLSLTYDRRFASRGAVATQYFDFIARRFARIYPLHLVTFLTMVVAWALAAHVGYAFQASAEYDTASAVYNLLLIHAWGMLRTLSWNTPSWSISAEWFAYLVVFPFCVLKLRHWRLNCLMLLTGLVWLLFVLYVWLVHDGRLGEVSYDGVVRIIPEFMAGYLAFRILSTRWRPTSVALYLLAAVIGMAAVLLQPQALPLLLPAIVCLMIALHAGGVWINRIFGNRLVVWLGEISYSVYMVHVFVLIIANQIVRRLAVSATPTHVVLILGLEFGATLIAGFAGYRLIECPARAELTRRLLGRRREQPLRELPVAVPGALVQRASVD